MASPTMGTPMTFELADFVSETVPEDDVKSPGADADPDAVAQLTWRAQHTFGGGAAWIVNDAVDGSCPRAFGHGDVGDGDGRGRGRGRGGGEGEDEHGGGRGPGDEPDQ